jgi:hypothetical protein
MDLGIVTSILFQMRRKKKLQLLKIKIIHNLFECKYGAYKSL